MPRLVVPEANQQRAGENLYVAPERPILDVVKIVLDAPLEGAISTPAIHLGPPGHARFDFVPQHILGDALAKPLD